MPRFSNKLSRNENYCTKKKVEKSNAKKGTITSVSMHEYSIILKKRHLKRKLKICYMY